MARRKVTAELLENRVTIWDPRAGSEVYKKGFYGKPMGIPKPKTSDFDVPLILDLAEALYLAEKGELKVVEPGRKRPLSLQRLRKMAEETYSGFRLAYMVYKDLRDHGYIVTPGIKFGCDFAVYEQGPGVDHAPYMVSVKSADEALTATEVVRAGRLATTVRKRFIIALPNPDTGKIEYTMFRWWKA
jgi:tRNA-intron endonuclease